MKRIAATLIFGTMIALGASAQSLQTAYFLDNFVYSYQLNPASRPDYTDGFFGVAIDNLSFGLNSNVGLESFVFPVTVDGREKLVTGFNSAVSAETFLDGIGNSLIMNGSVSENLFSFGFAKDESFITVEANLKTDASLYFPKEFLSLLKNGTSEPNIYSIGNVSANATIYAEIAGGYSRQFTDRLRVGGRLKILAGGADLSMDVRNLRAEVTDEIKTEGMGTVNAHILNKTIDENGEIADDYWGMGSLSYGAAIDLGAEYKPLPKMTVSASINDLGGIVWKQRLEASANMEQLSTDDFSDFKNSGQNDFIGLGARLNAGVRYEAMEMLSVGFLGTVRSGRFGWAEARIGATFTPGKAFSLAGSAGVNTFGTCFGAAMSLKVPIFNLYFGFDAMPTKFTPQYIPIKKLHSRVNLGLAIAF